jgi:hypothetical protein
LDASNFARLQDLLADGQRAIMELVRSDLTENVLDIFDALNKSIYNEFVQSEPEIQRLEDERKRLEQEHRLYMEKLTAKISDKHRSDKRKI